MELIELPHTAGCLVCGRENPAGLRLSLFVDPELGSVHVPYSPRAEQGGFVGIVHGGALATILDEAMVWAATWAGGRFCVCGEMNIRYRQPARVGMTLSIEARVEQMRSRLIRTSGVVRHGDTILCAATGSYVPMAGEAHRAVVASFVDEPATRTAARRLGREEPADA